MQHQVGKQKRPPGHAPPERASEFVLRQRLCRRWAKTYVYPGSIGRTYHTRGYLFNTLPNWDPGFRCPIFGPPCEQLRGFWHLTCTSQSPGWLNGPPGSLMPRTLGFLRGDQQDYEAKNANAYPYASVGRLTRVRLCRRDRTSALWLLL